MICTFVVIIINKSNELNNIFENDLHICFCYCYNYQLM